MIKVVLFSFAMTLFGFQNADAQSVTKTYTTKFVPNVVTYNASDDPGECWEAVAYGILVEDGKNSYFFSMPYLELEQLKEKIGDQDVVVEVTFYDEPFDGGGEDGEVVKITFNGEVVFSIP